MSTSEHPISELDEEAALRRILEGTATETGERFFYALVENLAKTMGTDGAWVTEYLEDKRRLRALAFWMDGEWVLDYDFDIAGTPCETVIDNGKLIHIPDRLIELYPCDPDLELINAVSYLGVPLKDVDGRILGHMAVVDRRPMPSEPKGLAIFNIFAARATAEMRRLRAEAEVREREEKLGRLVGSAMDAIIELDQELRVSRLNPAAEKMFQCQTAQVKGSPFRRLLSPDSHELLDRVIGKLQSRPEGQQYDWVSGLTVNTFTGEDFPAEATLSRYELKRQTCFTLILRNVNDRLEAERKIQSLSVEAEYLREELRDLQNFDEIQGESPALLRVLKDVDQVAETDATVLIFGETGTGKELIARSIHRSSGRKDGPLIKVNCAAIPSSLMESEFFGHEKGAFTGASAKREGRFALADGGTIFLDEVGELPLDLQGKLLRVLQEGEFEAVGSSQTRKVNVRVIAATNRDLLAEVQTGKFREDLYYRLNVFPLDVPPLRDRGDDVVLLAQLFADKFAQRIGRQIEPLTPECRRRLKAYGWPGNVRELENVMERAVITSRNGRLNLDRALPESDPLDDEPSCAGEEPVIRTVHEMQQLERANLIRALEATGWKVSGEQGAAQLLGMNPSTLSSRMKALGIKRPARS